MTARETVTIFYDSMSRGDVAAALDVLDAKVQWTEAQGFPYHAGTWTGPEAVKKGLLEPLGRDWDGFAVRAESYVAEDSTVVVFGTYTGTCKATGKSFAAPFAHRWIVSGGKVVNFQQHTDTALVLEAMRPA